MMELLYKTSYNELDAYITEHLVPSKEFQENVQDAVHRICSFLKERCSMDARVIKTVKGGSAGKGTTLDDNSDADLVIFLSCFSSYQDQAQKRASVINTIEKNLLQCCGSLAFKIDILPPRIKGEGRRSLSLTMQSRKKKEAVEVDILPAFDVLGQITLSFPLRERYKPPPQVYIDLIQAGGKPGEFNTSFTELQRNFVKHCPAKVKSLLRLVKHWYKECKKGLREKHPSVSLPPKFALELLTVYAWEEGTGRAEQFSTAEGFCTVMKLLLQYEELCIYWTDYYSLEDPIIGTHVKKHLMGQRPVIMDPADPTANVALGKGWDLLSKEASFCLNKSCCKKDSEPVTSWNVQIGADLDATVITEAIDEVSSDSIDEVILNQLQCVSTEDMDKLLGKPARNLLEIEISVKDTTSRTVVYTVLPNETVLDLKKKIEARTKIPVDQQRLTYKDRELHDQNTIVAYNIRSKDTVYLLLRLRGGHMSF